MQYKRSDEKDTRVAHPGDTGSGIRPSTGPDSRTQNLKLAAESLPVEPLRLGTAPKKAMAASGPGSEYWLP